MRKTFLSLFAFLALSLNGAEVEFRLVPFNHPDIGVDFVVGQKNSQASQYLYTLTEGERHAFFPPHTAWARNIRIDGKPAFEIFLNGKYIDRVPRTRLSLAKGKHVLTPGDHELVVDENGTVKSDDTDFIITIEPRHGWVPQESVVDGAIAKANVKALKEPEEGAKSEASLAQGAKVEVLEQSDGWAKLKLPPLHLVKVKCYPFKLRAVRHNETDAPRERAGLDQIPLPNIAMRLADAEGTGPERMPRGHSKSYMELIPQGGGRFLNLTLWMPSNTVGAGYHIHPLRQTFHLTKDGLESGKGEGGYAESTWRSYGQELRIPVNRIAATGEPGGSIHIKEMQMISFGKDEPLKFANLYARKDPFELRVSEYGPGLIIDGDLSYLPNKLIRVDWTDGTKLWQKGLVVESTRRHLNLGEKIKARVRAFDPTEGSKAELAVLNLEERIETLEKQIVPIQQKVNAALTKLYNGDPMIKQDANVLLQAQLKIKQLTTLHDTEEKKLEAIQVRITSALDVVKKAEQELATKKANNDPAATITAAEAKVAQAKTAQDKEVAALAAQKTKIADVGTQIAAAETASKVADAKVQQTIAAVLKTNKTVSPLHKAFTTIEINLKSFEGRIVSSKAELVEKKKAYEAVANKTPLENAEIFAALKPRKSPQWTDLGAKPSGPDEVEIDVPAGIPAGIYTLRVGIRSTSGNGPPFFADQWITVAGNNDAGIGSFTKRGRTAFLLGETFWLAVAATSDQKSLPAGTKAEAGKRHTFLIN